jgi:hypothetical protein
MATKSFLGYSSFDGDSINVTDFDSNVGNIAQLTAKTITTDEFILTTGAGSNKVLTSDSVGKGSWQVRPPVTLVGDASGLEGATVVNTLAGGTIHVEDLATIYMVNYEVARAMNAEGTLTFNLNAEISRATNAENTLTSNLNSEITRATTAEGTLTTNLNAEITRATNAENTLTSHLSSEITRATNAENTIATNLSAEVTRAINAENSIATNLTAEITRATNAETAINADKVTLTGTQTLTNKTLTTPIISTIVGGSGTNFTLPTSGGSSGNVLSTNGSGVTSWITTSPTTLAGDCNGAISTNTVTSLRGGTVTVPSGTDTLVTLGATQTLTGKTFGGIRINSPNTSVATANTNVMTLYSTNASVGQLNIDFMNPSLSALLGRIRCDFDGRMNYVSLLRHAFLTGGDYGVGTERLVVDSSGLTVTGGLTTTADISTAAGVKSTYFATPSNASMYIEAKGDSSSLVLVKSGNRPNTIYLSSSGTEFNSQGTGGLDYYDITVRSSSGHTGGIRYERRSGYVDPAHSDSGEFQIVVGGVVRVRVGGTKTTMDGDLCFTSGVVDAVATNGSASSITITAQSGRMFTINGTVTVYFPSVASAVGKTYKFFMNRTNPSFNFPDGYIVTSGYSSTSTGGTYVFGLSAGTTPSFGVLNISSDGQTWFFDRAS